MEPIHISWLFSFTPTVEVHTLQYAYYGIPNLTVLRDLKELIAATGQVGMAIMHLPGRLGHGLFLRVVALPWGTITR